MYYWVLAMLTTWALLACAPVRSAQLAPVRDASDRRWRLGRRYWIGWGLTPVVLLALTVGAMAVQQAPHVKGRLRFGPHAHWRLELEKSRANGGN